MFLVAISAAELEARVKAHVRAEMKLFDLQLVKPVREHPMPGWKGFEPLPPTAPPETYTPERVLKEWMHDYRLPEYYATTLVDRLKKHGYIIAT